MDNLIAISAFAAFIMSAWYDERLTYEQWQERAEHDNRIKMRLDQAVKVSIDVYEANTPST